jgi:hypothetical protein
MHSTQMRLAAPIGRPRAWTMLFMVLAAALSSAVCSLGGGNADLKGVTLDQVRDEMAAAMFPTNAIMHTHESFEPKGGTQTVTPGQDIWRSASTGEARIEAGSASPRIFAVGARHSLGPDGTVQSLPYAALEDNRALLGSASAIFNENAEGVRPKRAKVDGKPAIRLDVFLSNGMGEVYLSEADYLPIKVEYPSYTAITTHEIVDRSSLPADFFSPDSLRSTGPQ